MITIRRWYIFLVCAISLQSIAWALIALLRYLFTFDRLPTLEIAFALSVIIIGLPIFLVHWLWEQKLAQRDLQERESLLRRVYLYGILAAFLFPWIFQAFQVINELLSLLADQKSQLHDSSIKQIWRSLIALVPLSVFWLYHFRVIRDIEKEIPPVGGNATVRRLYVLVISAFSLAMIATSSSNLLRVIIQLISGESNTASRLWIRITPEIAWLLIGVPIWLIHWRWAQMLFYNHLEEKSSALRKFYLYAWVFISVLAVVGNLTVILAGALRRLLGLKPSGEAGGILATIIIMAVVWAYHAIQIQRDAAEAAEAPQQATIRRIYLYLVAGIGLTAFLVGLGGEFTVLIQAIDQETTQTMLKENLAWFTSSLIAGLPVWYLSWRRIQKNISVPDERGEDESRSLVRRIYLYVFIFAATMTMLGSAIVIVYRIISTLLGEDAISASEFAQALAFSLIAVGVWAYHGYLIRTDSRRLQAAEKERLAEIPVLIIGLADQLAAQISSQLHQENPGILVTVASTAGEDTLKPIEKAGILVLPWTFLESDEEIPVDVQRAITISSARKILVPVWRSGYDWAGVENWDEGELTRHTTQAISQILAGEVVRLSTRLGVGAIVAITIGALILLGIGISLIGSLIDFLL